MERPEFGPPAAGPRRLLRRRLVRSVRSHGCGNQHSESPALGEKPRRLLCADPDAGAAAFYCSPARLRRALRDFGIAATPEEIDRCFQHELFTALYADEFFRLLGAQETTSVDRSDFEGATLLHDLNDPFPERLRGRLTWSWMAAPWSTS